MKLKKIISFDGTIECITGIAIKGAGNDLGIGGADSEVVKNPLTGEPYLPGSSLKGKMRSQLERKYGKMMTKKVIKKGIETYKLLPCRCGKSDCLVCTMFGAHNNQNAQSAPTRITVRDCPMTEAFRQEVRELLLERGSYLEIKNVPVFSWPKPLNAENIIDRKQGLADSPRFMERVPAGASFELHISLQIFEGDDEARLVDFVQEGLRLVEASSLGGSGSRGYGQVKFDYEVTVKEV